MLIGDLSGKVTSDPKPETRTTPGEGLLRELALAPGELNRISPHRLVSTAPPED